jgi:hypothetical protein
MCINHWDPARAGVRRQLGLLARPIITTLGMVFSFLLGANVLVEKVFA